MSSGIKNIFSAIRTFWRIRGTPQAFNHQQRNPAEHFYAFKHQQHRLYRLLYLQFKKVSGNSTDETDETNTPGPLIDELVHFKVCLRDEDINFRIKIRKLCRHGVENLVFGNTV